jgi:hypothetical protein|tara:strand:- start:708 stop:815 length:108 start_codon:yes stop_codon:yes gene_type:complete
MYFLEVAGVQLEAFSVIDEFEFFDLEFLLAGSLYA